MTKKYTEDLPCTCSCSVDFAFRRIGGKYKGRILWYLHLNSIMRYGEIRKTLTDITPKMLTQTLRELGEDGLINRKEYPQIPPKVEYTLSKTGQELIPFISHLKDWGDRQRELQGERIEYTTDCTNAK